MQTKNINSFLFSRDFFLGCENINLCKDLRSHIWSYAAYWQKFDMSKKVSSSIKHVRKADIWVLHWVISCLFWQHGLLLFFKWTSWFTCPLVGLAVINYICCTRSSFYPIYYCSLFCNFLNRLMLSLPHRIVLVAGYCAYLDVENAMDPSLVESMGINTENLLISWPISAENLLSVVNTLTRRGAVDVIVVDSVSD